VRDEVLEVGEEEAGLVSLKLLEADDGALARLGLRLRLELEVEPAVQLEVVLDPLDRGVVDSRLRSLELTGPF